MTYISLSSDLALISKTVKHFHGFTFYSGLWFNRDTGCDLVLLIGQCDLHFMVQ